MQVAIGDQAAARTPEDLAAAETTVDVAAATAGLARVGLVDEDDAASGVLARLGHQPLAEAVVLAHVTMARTVLLRSRRWPRRIMRCVSNSGSSTTSCS